MNIPGFLASIIGICIVLISGYSLLYKTDFEKVFMTTEQKLKQKLVMYVLLIGYTTFLVPFLYIMCNISINNSDQFSIDWNKTISIAITTFFTSSFIVLVCIKKINNFVIKEKTMYKVDVEDIGEVYLIKMFDKEICICSLDANTDLENLSEKIFLIKMDDLMKLPILKEKIPLPTRSIYQKLLN